MLARGDKTPVKTDQLHSIVLRSTACHTSPEPMQTLCLICVAHAVAERVEFVAVEISAARDSR